MKLKLNSDRIFNIVVIWAFIILGLFLLFITSEVSGNMEYRSFWAFLFPSAFFFVGGFVLGWKLCLRQIKNKFFENIKEGKYSHDTKTVFRGKAQIVVDDFKIESIFIESKSFEQYEYEEPLPGAPVVLVGKVQEADGER